MYLDSRGKEVITVKGYFTATGYMGYIDGRYRLFATEGDYRDYYIAQ